jgi:hypothetical protein
MPRQFARIPSLLVLLVRDKVIILHLTVLSHSVVDKVEQIRLLVQLGVVVVEEVRQQ